MSGKLPDILLEIYRLLRDHFGHRNWWPGDSPFEVVVGAILTQNTAWTNVEKAIDNLKADGSLSVKCILFLPDEKLAGLIRPSGYFNQKARRLKSVCRYLIDCCEGNPGNMGDKTTIELRRELLAIKGIGPETADSILLYAMNRPVFVVDAYTGRVMRRLGLIDDGAKYDDIQRLFTDNLPPDIELYNDYHAQFVALGKDFCRNKPRCGGCPLREICSFDNGEKR